MVVSDAGQVQAGQTLQDHGRRGSLQGQERVVPAAVLEGAAFRGLRLQPGPVLLDVARVDDQQVAVGSASVDDHVVHGRPVRQGQGRVLRLAVHQPGHVVRGHPLQEGERPAPLHLKLAHVGDVEEAGRPAHGQVLGDEARVLHGHFPSAEGNHLGPALPVNSVQRRLVQQARSGCQGRDPR